MSLIYINATERFRPCDKDAGIKRLVPDGSGKAYDLINLKDLADRGQLWTLPRRFYPSAKIRIFWHPTYRRYVATTLRDDLECNNLLSLPIVNESAFGRLQACPI
jgi:hypothetical protein